MNRSTTYFLILFVGLLFPLNKPADGQTAASLDTSKIFREAHKALKVANREKSEAGKITAMLGLARYHDHYGDVDSAIHYYLLLKKNYAAGSNFEGVAETCLELNGLFGAKAEYSLAMEQLFEALEIYEGQENLPGIALCYAFIGDLLYYENKYEESVDYCNKAIAIQEALDLKTDLATSYYYKAASLLFVEKQLEYALQTINKAIALYKELGESGDPYLASINGRGNILKFMGRYDEAIADYQFLYKRCLALGMENRTIAPLANIGHVYVLQEKWEEAIPYFLQAIEMMKRTGNTKNLWENYYHLADSYEHLGDYEKAYIYRELEAEEREAYYNTIIERLESEAQVKYETMKKDEQLKLQEETIASQRKVQLLYISIALILILSLAGMLRSRANIRKKQRELEQSRNQLQASLENLKRTQSQLVHAEKMASLGELTAGIAHEIQNPLNFVNNFSDVSVDLMEELDEEIKTGDPQEIEAISTDLKQNLEKIKHHGKRASSIVRNMLEHSRTGTGEKELTDINALADEYLRLAYHGIRAKNKKFQSDYQTKLDQKMPRIKIKQQDVGRVLLNLVNNAFYAVHDKALSTEDPGYKPRVTISTSNNKDHVEIRVQDNGPGIPDQVLKKIFQPFFTTKPTGEGTGLGLSLSYDIITKGHGGQLKVLSKENAGSTFIIHLPIN